MIHSSSCSIVECALELSLVSLSVSMWVGEASATATAVFEPARCALHWRWLRILSAGLPLFL